jgi:O-antigen/teichoic acid export membrane protein
MMSSGGGLLRNTLALSIPNALNPLLSFALVLAVSRYLGVKGLGEYSLVLSYQGLFSVIGSLGLADLIVREVAKDSASAHTFLFNGGLFGAVWSLVTLAAMDLMVMAMGYDEDVVLAAIICSFTLTASTLVAYLEAVFRAFEKSEYVALTFVTENAARVALSLGLLFAGYGVVSLFVVVLGARMGAAAMMMCLYTRSAGFPPMRFDASVMRLLAREAPTFAGISIFSTVHLTIDQIMLSKLQSLEAVGIYSAADRLLTMAKTFPLAFASALLPLMSRQSHLGREGLRRLTTDSLRIMFLLGFPVVVGTLILAPQFIELIYGHKFVSAGAILRLHIVSLLPFSVVFLLAQALIATNNQKVDLRINIAAAFINFGLNFAFIPFLEAQGAVLATLLTILIFCGMQINYIKKTLFPLHIFGFSARILGASLLMGAVTFLLRDWNLGAAIAISALAYACCALALGAVSIKDVRQTLNALSSDRTPTAA